MLNNLSANKKMVFDELNYKNITNKNLLFNYNFSADLIWFIPNRITNAYFVVFTFEVFSEIFVFLIGFGFSTFIFQMYKMYDK